jgi:anti-sigma regulatory factor (Ser/Thr protein kinase)
VIAQAHLHVTSHADLEAPRPLRHVLTSLLTALDVKDPRRSDIVLAVGEALANAVEHAYAGRETGTVELTAQTNAQHALVVEVSDRGRFIEPRETQGRGFGLRIVRNIARDVIVNHDNGTRITMTFDLAS